jgi:NAD(P)-dependent dehydrogenase (short-subunit alcohol dehydrogenase family)
VIGDRAGIWLGIGPGEDLFAMSALDGKAIVIIGGTSGIGRSAARAFAREGARLVLVGRDDGYLEETARELGDRARVFAGDAALPETAAGAVRMCRDAYGKLDGLYHVAGGSGRLFGDGRLHELPDRAVSDTLALNLHSVIFSNRAAIRAWMDEGRGGSVLNLASVLALSPSPRYFATAVYAAAKEGIVGFSRSIAACYATADIRVNVLAPGLTDTPMARRAVTDTAILEFLRRKQPLQGGRVGVPEDLDAASVFFMSDGSRFCTGQVLAVDGGWSVSEGGPR